MCPKSIQKMLSPSVHETWRKSMGHSLSKNKQLTLLSLIRVPRMRRDLNTSTLSQIGMESTTRRSPTTSCNSRVILIFQVQSCRKTFRKKGQHMTYSLIVTLTSVRDPWLSEWLILNALQQGMNMIKYCSLANETCMKVLWELDLVRMILKRYEVGITCSQASNKKRLLCHLRIRLRAFSMEVSIRNSLEKRLTIIV